ncbi:hypothetical protein GIB67_015048 [Kingdonia uniflora]|uniref:Uncharacterized protein n=1 Tax=Kingdonia uniflora TaxID=39325 RepID=A0A7J7NMP8_9MAGN|nr:hypothetical protein GIB67_015048 [Kingdonia uniflora]
MHAISYEWGGFVTNFYWLITGALLCLFAIRRLISFLEQFSRRVLLSGVCKDESWDSPTRYEFAVEMKAFLVTVLNVEAKYNYPWGTELLRLFPAARRVNEYIVWWSAYWSLRSLIEQFLGRAHLRGVTRPKTRKKRL